MFIRLKKIKNQYYAYHVQNRRVWGKVKQKVKGYLGKAIFPKKVNNATFLKFIKQDMEVYSPSLKKAVQDLVNWELYKYNLKEISFDKEKLSITKNNQKIIIKMNEGYMYDKTLKDIVNFHAVGDDDYFIGKEFAESFVKAGIDIPKELFVKLFEKTTKENKIS